MTAEIAILNKAAVALAADSTVTIGGSDTKKTYQSANKLFTLSKHEPIGVMVYGSAGLMDVPWETIIKQYRGELGTKGFPIISDYVKDFIRFLERSTKGIFTGDLQRSWLAMSVLGYFDDVLLGDEDEDTDGINHAVKKAATAAGGTLSAKEIAKIASDIINDHWDKTVSAIKLLPVLPKQFENSIARDYRKSIDAAIKQSFKLLPISTKTRQNLRRIAARIICGEVFPDNLMSGVVFAGFGREQIFPECRTIAPQCIAGNRLVYMHEAGESHAVTHENGAVLIPFAQKDVVDSFLRGIDRRYLKIVNEAMKTISHDYPALALQYCGTTDPAKKAEIQKKLAEQTKKLAKDLQKKLNEHRDEHHVHPLLAIIGILPKNELAEMAEALVSLTSLKRKMSRDLETVGGPIDVAVISKGDGFIWIKRKHYFKPEFNPNFARNYLRENAYENHRPKARS